MKIFELRDGRFELELNFVHTACVFDPSRVFLFDSLRSLGYSQLISDYNMSKVVNMQPKQIHNSQLLTASRKGK